MCLTCRHSDVAMHVCSTFILLMLALYLEIDNYNEAMRLPSSFCFLNDLNQIWTSHAKIKAYRNHFEKMKNRTETTQRKFYAVLYYVI